VGLSPAITSLFDAIVGTARAAVDLGLTGWVPESLRDAAATPQRWAEYAPLEFFLGLVLIVGVVMLICVVSGLVNAVLLQITARRVEALVVGDAENDPETLKKRLSRAFRASRRLSRMGRRYSGMLQRSASGDGLVSALPAQEVLTTEALAASASKLRSERLLAAIVTVGGIVILVELAVGLLRFRDQLGDPNHRIGLDLLLDPAMSGATFALACILLTAISVGIYRIILRIVGASLGRLQAAVDARFYFPEDAALLDGPSLAWPDDAAAIAALQREEFDLGPSLSTTVPASGHEGPSLETGDAARPAREPSAARISAAQFVELRALIATLAEEVAIQRKGLGHILSRVSAPPPNAGAIAAIEQATAELRPMIARLAEEVASQRKALGEVQKEIARPPPETGAAIERLGAELLPMVAGLAEEAANQRRTLGEVLKQIGRPSPESGGGAIERVAAELRPMIVGLAEEAASQRKAVGEMQKQIGKPQPETGTAAIERLSAEFRLAVAALAEDIAGQRKTLGEVLKGIGKALPETGKGVALERQADELRSMVAALAEDVAGQRKTLAEAATRMSATPSEGRITAALERLATEFRPTIAALGEDVASQRKTLVEAVSRMSAPPAKAADTAGLERSMAEFRPLVAALAEQVAGQRKTLDDVLKRLNAPPPEDGRAAELAQLLKSASEIGPLADVMRASLAQLAIIAEKLSRSGAAPAAVPTTAPAQPPTTVPGMVRELRSMLRDVETADRLAEISAGLEGGDEEP